MKADLPFHIPSGWRFGVHLASVTSVRDDMSLGRVQIRLTGADPDGEALVMARVAVPFAGPDAGAFFIPDVGDEVLVSFLAGDSRQPVVIGALWNGAQRPPETLTGDRVDKWTITGRNGTRIAILEEKAGGDAVSLETPMGVTALLTDEGGGKVEIIAAGNSVVIDPSGITVKAAAGVTVKAPKVEISAGTVTVNAALSTFNGAVKCDALTANSVASASYSPGAGNVW
jgi:uncharacterized protein involved in type VI secretion and phage assembly